MSTSRTLTGKKFSKNIQDIDETTPLITVSYADESPEQGPSSDLELQINHLLTLPLDIFTIILPKLSANDLFNLSSTSKQMYQIADINNLPSFKLGKIPQTIAPHSSLLKFAASNYERYLDDCTHDVQDYCYDGCENKCSTCCADYCCCSARCTIIHLFSTSVGLVGTAAFATYFVTEGAEMAPGYPLESFTNYLATIGTSLALGGVGGYLANMAVIGAGYGLLQLGLFAYSKCRDSVRQNVAHDLNIINTITNRLKSPIPIEEDEYKNLIQTLKLKKGG